MHRKHVSAPHIRLAFCVRISPISSGEVSGEAYGKLVSQLESNEFRNVHSLSNGTTFIFTLAYLYYPICKEKGKTKKGPLDYEYYGIATASSQCSLVLCPGPCN